MNKLKTIFVSFLWYLGGIMEFISIPLYAAALRNIAITYKWFEILRGYEHIKIVYGIVALVTMAIFSILVMIMRKEKRASEMVIALICFMVQAIGLITVLAVQIDRGINILA